MQLRVSSKIAIVLLALMLMAQTPATSTSNIHSGFGTSGTSYGGFGYGSSGPTYGSTGTVYGADFAPKFMPNPWSHCAVGNVGYFMARGLSARNVLGLDRIK